MNRMNTVLLVDTDPKSSSAIESIMQAENFSIIKAGNFDEALTVINSESVSRIILGSASSGERSQNFVKHVGERVRGKKTMICHLTDSEKSINCFPRVTSEVTQFSISRKSEIHLLREKFRAIDNNAGSDKAEQVLEEVFGTLRDYTNEMCDSIRYASKIQKAVLPGEHSIRKIAESFVLNTPKNIVSGDFFWFTVRFNRVIIGVADCTGHGVPGALLSLIGHDMLNTIVNEKNVTEPSEILKNLNLRFQRIFENKELDSPLIKDGMDIGIISINPVNRTIEYAGARRPLTAIVNGELKKIKGDFHSIGVHTPSSVAFSQHRLIFGSQDLFYLGSDGFADQFGGPLNKKIGTRQFDQVLCEIYQYPLDVQKNKLEEFFIDWKQNNAQTDDVLILGIKPGSLQ